MATRNSPNRKIAQPQCINPGFATNAVDSSPQKQRQFHRPVRCGLQLRFLMSERSVKSVEHMPTTGTAHSKRPILETPVICVPADGQRENGRSENFPLVISDSVFRDGATIDNSTSLLHYIWL